MNSDISPITNGRKCGTCTMCCKILRIQELNKPQGKWCDHCNIGVSCQKYESRPDECRNFYCGYLQIEDLSDDWIPSKAKFVLVAELDGKRIAAHVDPTRPNAWKEEPYYSGFKAWAEAVVPHQGQVVAYIGKRAIVILPDRDVDLGEIAEDELIVTEELNTPTGIMLNAFKMKKDNPRARHLSPIKILPKDFPPFHAPLTPPKEQ